MQHDVAEDRHRALLPLPPPPATAAADATCARTITKKGQPNPSVISLALLALLAAVPQFFVLTYPNPPTLHAPASLPAMLAMCRIRFTYIAFLAPTLLELVRAKTAATMFARFTYSKPNLMSVDK